MIKETQIESCSNCGKIVSKDDVYYCPNCEEPLCPYCVCTCRTRIAKAIAEAEEAPETITKIRESTARNEFALLGAVDLNLPELGELIINTSLDYHNSLDPKEKDRLSILYADLARHYNKLLGRQIITESI